MVSLTRTFHPIGFGAFYTECHKTIDKEINIVYDCGTITKNVNLKNYIENLYPKDSTIDILFISHFHADHINGIPYLKEHCKIKKVVIPYIPEIDRLLFVYINELNDFSQLIINTEEYFGKETEVIRIKPEQEDELSNSFQSDSINYEEKNANIPSGTPINIPLTTSHTNSQWYFIPFNFDHTKNITNLKAILQCNGLEYNNLNEENYIIDNFQTISKTYRDTLKSNTNDSSIILFSGTTYNTKPSLFFISYWLNKIKNGNVNMLKRYYCLSLPNCIYFGDVSLNSKRISCLKSKLNKIDQTFWKAIQTIQIPHHGSKNNFNPAILTPYLTCIISCDFIHFKSPSCSVIHDILKSGSLLKVVTHQKHTQFTEHAVY